MYIDKKPKCRGCGNVGDELFYYFQKEQRGKGGYLWHLSCAQEMDKLIKESKEVLVSARI